jgi:hypothetical protein
MNKSRILAFASTLGLLGFTAGAYADEQPSTPANGVAAPLQSQARVIDLELNNMRDILIDVQRAKGCASSLYDEVNRHPMTMVSMPNVVGATAYSIPQPIVDTSQLLPARQKWVELYMGEIKPIVTYMKTDMDAIRTGEAALQLAPSIEQELQPELDTWGKDIDQAFICTTNLEKLTAAPPYDNRAIAQQTTELHKTMSAMEKTGKRVVKIMKKCEKKRKRA